MNRLTTHIGGTTCISIDVANHGTGDTNAASGAVSMIADANGAANVVVSISAAANGAASGAVSINADANGAVNDVVGETADAGSIRLYDTATTAPPEESS